MAREAGLTFLPEVGLDPGLEHMSIASMKTRIEERSGRDPTDFNQLVDLLCLLDLLEEARSG